MHENLKGSLQPQKMMLCADIAHHYLANDGGLIFYEIFSYIQLAYFMIIWVKEHTAQTERDVNSNFIKKDLLYATTYLST